MKLLLSALLPLLCLATAAAAEPAPTTPVEVDTSQSTDPVPPTLTFGASWSVSLAGRPLVGGPLRIVYDLSRLAQCRGASWGITGYYMTNHGTVQSFPVADASTPGTVAEALLNLTTGGNMELWFHGWDSTGCSAWDSNLGWNFRTQVWQDPTLTFNEGWTHSLFGTLQAGSTLMVDYDIDRLGQCRAYYAQYTAWGVQVYYRFDGGPVQWASLTVGWGEWDTEFRAQAPAFIPIPAGATNLEMWFYNGDRKNCEAWDSRFGQNYHFTIQ